MNVTPSLPSKKCGAAMQWQLPQLVEAEGVHDVLYRLLFPQLAATVNPVPRGTYENATGASSREQRQHMPW